MPPYDIGPGPYQVGTFEGEAIVLESETARGFIALIDPATGKVFAAYWPR